MVRKALAIFGVMSVIGFSNPIVGESTLIRDAIQSEGFVTGSQGWRIARNGDAEFNNITARGTFKTAETGKKIWINGADAPNGIAFYTGDSVETFPGVVQPDSDSTSLSLFFGSPARSGNNGSDFIVGTGKTGSNNFIQADTTDYTVNAGGKVDLNGLGDARILMGLPTNTLQLIATTITANNPIGLDGSSWANLTLTGTWVTNGGLTPQYRKDAAGNVQIRGRVNDPGAGGTTTIFTLPSGFRPTSTMEYALKANNDAGTIAWIQLTNAGAFNVVGNVAAARTQLVLTCTFTTL